MSHSLIEIPRTEWQKLCDMYSDRKTDCAAYSLLENYINWATKGPAINAKIYALDGIWKTDGTYILIDPDMNMKFVYFNTLDENLTRLKDALNCLDMKETLNFSGFHERIVPALEEHLINAGLDAQKFREECTIWYHIEREKVLAFNVEPPAEIRLAALKLQHAEIIDNRWRFHAHGSIKFVERLVRFNINVGAFDKDDNLIAWCLRYPNGGLGFLHVEASHRRKGLGNLLVRHIARCIVANNEEVIVSVERWNKISRAMFEKLGAHQIEKFCWAMTGLENLKN